MLTAAGRRRRLIAVVLVMTALIAGTFWGDDDNWPIGPFRMYSIRNRLDGRVKAARLEIMLSDGSKIEERIGSYNVALRRAEVEGQMERFQRDPALLRHLASTYEELHPDSPDVVGIRLYYEITSMKGGRPAGDVSEVTMATWGAM